MPLVAKRTRIRTLCRSSQLPPSAAASPMLSAFLALAAQQYQQQQQQQQQQAAAGSAVVVKDLCFHPPGAEAPLLSGVNMSLQANTLNLIIGRSGSGKTTLLQLLAGLSEQTSGQVIIGQQPSTLAAAASPQGATAGSSLEERMQKVGVVFQFPERHFLGDSVASELSFAWPPAPQQRWELSNRAQSVLAAVGLSNVPLHLHPWALSGGQQRRLALAVQLVRKPSLLLLDEPLAGLDWQSRAEVASLLAELKRQCTLLIVSHDLREVASLVDCAFEMKPGGALGAAEWPPAELGRVWCQPAGQGGH